MKVLIVEDSEPVRRMIKRVLEHQVDEFFECSDGSEALARYQQCLPDVVLMDIKMTKVDGFYATRQIKQIFADARVVIVSQWDTPALRQAAEESGAENYVCKNNLLPLREFLSSASSHMKS